MITKAIIPVAGWGTRRLPITKAIEKCMLPIGNRPLVDYVVQDCIDAGITDIYFVVSEGSTQLQWYYEHNKALESYLAQNGKQAQLATVAPPSGVAFHYITQPVGGRYGTAIPVALAAPYLAKGESAVVVMGDDFTYKPGINDIARLLEAAEATGNAMLCAQVPRESVSRYGVVEKTAKSEYVRIIEHPAPEEAPSTLINISKYVMSAELLERIAQFVEKTIEGEYFIIDPMNDFVQNGGGIRVLAAEGEYLDGGSVEGWLHANRVVLGDA